MKRGMKVVEREREIMRADGRKAERKTHKQKTYINNKDKFKNIKN